MLVAWGGLAASVASGELVARMGSAAPAELVGPAVSAELVELVGSEVTQVASAAWDVLAVLEGLAA